MTGEAPHSTPGGRKAAIAAVVWTFVFWLIAFSIALPGAHLVALGVTGGSESASQWMSTIGPTQMVVHGLATLGGALLATYLVGVRRFGMTGSDLRWKAPWPPLRGFGAGLLYGIMPALGILVATTVLGDASWAAGDDGVAAMLVSGSRVTLGLTPAALAEEVLFRGVPIVLMAVVVGRGSSVVLVAVLFGLIHLSNPHVTAMGVANVALAGVLLGTVFYGPGGLWAAFGAHLGWNSTLAVSGAEVSGLPFEVSSLEFQAGGPEWLTGGAFGPEGGLLATVMLGLAVVVAARHMRSGEV